MAKLITKAMAWLARDGVAFLPATEGYVSDIKAEHACGEAPADFFTVTKEVARRIIKINRAYVI